MRFHEVAGVIAESKATSEKDFARLHPDPAFVIEPFAASIGGATEDTVTDLVAPPVDDSGAVKRATKKVHQNARICWIGEVPVGTSIRLGRDPSCEIQLPHPRISKHHTTVKRVAVSGLGAWVAADYGSTNGTVLNGRRLKLGDLAPLADGDRLALGSLVILRPYFTPAALYRVLRTAE